MEPVPLCKGEIILTIERPETLMAQLWENSGVSAVVVPDAETITTAKRTLNGKPVGLMINADGWNPEEDFGAKWPSERLIGRFRNIAARAIHDEADFLYIRMRQNLHVLRAAVLGATDLPDASIMVELPVDEEGRTPDGASAMAVVGILQRIGVSAVILTGEWEDIDETLAELSPHVQIALGVSIEDAHALDHMKQLSNVAYYHTLDSGDVYDIISHIPPITQKDEPDADDDYILAPVGMHAHFVDATIDISDPIDLEDRFGESLLDLEDQWSGALKLEIHSADDVHLLSEYQYLINRPVCLEVDSPELFEEALRVFDGIALYDGTMELEEKELTYFRDHYGLVFL